MVAPRHLKNYYEHGFVKNVAPTQLNLPNISGPPHAPSHWGEKFFNKGQGRLKQLNLEQDPGHNTG